MCAVFFLPSSPLPHKVQLVLWDIELGADVLVADETEGPAPGRTQKDGLLRLSELEGVRRLLQALTVRGKEELVCGVVQQGLAVSTRPYKSPSGHAPCGALSVRAHLPNALLKNSKRRG